MIFFMFSPVQIDTVQCAIVLALQFKNNLVIDSSHKKLKHVLTNVSWGSTKYQPTYLAIYLSIYPSIYLSIYLVCK